MILLLATLAMISLRSSRNATKIYTQASVLKPVALAWFFFRRRTQNQVMVCKKVHVKKVPLLKFSPSPRISIGLGLSDIAPTLARTLGFERNEYAVRVEKNKKRIGDWEFQ